MLNIILITGVIYLVLFFFDVFFKSCSLYPYARFLQETGLEVRFLHLKWTTTAFNRFFLKWGNNKIKWLHNWFTVGLYASLIMLPLAILLLLVSLYQILSTQKGEISEPVLEPVIPSVNLPLSELGYYSFSLIVSSVFHEVGHALAAVKEDVHLVNFGMAVFFVMPVAFVNISVEKLMSVNPWRALCILTAGVWHNIILAVIAYIFLTAGPYLFSFTYYIDNGVFVTHVDQYSFLSGAKGINVGDILTQVNDCTVKNDATWTNCLMNYQGRNPGFCVSIDHIHLLDESATLKQLPNGAIDCCGSDRQDRLCFEYADTNNGILHLPQHMCLPVRKLIENHVQYYCDIKTNTCPNNLHCIHPLLANTSTLLKIKRIQRSDIIYIGHPLDVLTTVITSPFVPRKLFSTTIFPDMYQKVFKYLFVFSLGLAIANITPCFYMDGQYITSFIVHITLKRQVPNKQTLQLISNVITCCGTFVLAFLMLHTLWSNL